MFEIEKMEQEFDYSLVDNETADFLRSCEYEINGITEDARIKVGGVLLKARDKLGNNKNGVFQKWLASGRISKDDAYYYINLNISSRNLDNIKLDNFLNAPKTLQKEVMKKNAPEELKQKVYEGDITTNKEYQELKRQLEQAESQAETERKERERLENELENQEPEVKEVFKEIDNTDYETIKKLEDEIEQLKKKSELESQDAETYRQLKKDIDNLRNRKSDIVKQIDNASSIGKFIARIDRSFEEDLAPIKYSRAIEELERSESVQESLNEIVSKVENWCREIRGIMKNNNITEVIDYEEQ